MNFREKIPIVLISSVMIITGHCEQKKKPKKLNLQDFVISVVKRPRNGS